jgi:hypothetical protein
MLYLQHLGSSCATNALIAHIRSTVRRGKSVDIRANYLHGALWPLHSCKTASAE